MVETTGVNADGPRELLGLQVGDSESETIWRVFLSGLKQRGLTGIRLVVSDAHVGTPEKAYSRLGSNAANERRVGRSHAYLYSDQ